MRAMLRRIEKLEMKHCAEDVVIIKRFDGTVSPPGKVFYSGEIKGTPIVIRTKKRFDDK